MSLKDAIREAVDERDKKVADAEPVTISSNAVNTASKKAIKAANSKAINTAKPTDQRRAGAEEIPVDETAAMTVRVSRRHRLHWLISAKQQGTSLTAAITEALNERFGEPVN